jgi:hypothetical protein
MAGPYQKPSMNQEVAAFEKGSLGQVGMNKMGYPKKAAAALRGIPDADKNPAPKAAYKKLSSISIPGGGSTHSGGGEGKSGIDKPGFGALGYGKD